MATEKIFREEEGEIHVLKHIGLGLPGPMGMGNQYYNTNLLIKLIIIIKSMSNYELSYLYHTIFV